MNVHLTFLCLILQLILAVVFFTSGFFPVKLHSGKISSEYDITNSIHNDSWVDPSFMQRPHVKKLVIMVVDALRYDFVTNKNDMPYLNNALSSRNSCLLRVKVEAPTVTMPRIKALMSGSIPGYSDVVFNFLEQKSTTDNLLVQVRNKGLLSVFYGDKTWIDLYPNIFNRSEGTTSFMVSDFTEVDDNVTRNVIQELDKKDWNLMVLHYLGLDHIGHIEGPFSPLIQPKLLEMDDIISLIDSSILKQNNESEKAVLMICSDHGMKDSGSHGGTSVPEIFVPYAFLNYGCDNNLREEEINQIDITPFLSVLLGLPIPAESIGVLHYKLLQGEMNISTVLHMLHYNAMHIKEIISQYEGTQNFIRAFSTAEKMLEKLILSNYSLSYEHTLNEYQHALKESSNYLIKKSINYNEYMLYSAMFILFQILVHIVFESSLKLSSERVILFSLSLTPSLYFTYRSMNEVYCVITALIYFNVYLLKPNRGLESYFQALVVFSQRRYWLLILLIMHLTTLGSSSFIEEEHLFWYYCFTTFLFMNMLQKNKWGVLLMIVHIVCQSMNSTGVKYASVPDIGDWLNTECNSLWLTIFYLIGVGVIFSWCYYFIQLSRESFKILDGLFLTILSICVILLKMNHDLIKTPFLLINGYLYGLIIIWALSTLWIIFCLFNTKQNIFYHRCHVERYRSSVVHLIDGIILLMIFSLCLVFKAHNVFVITCILIYSSLSKTLCRGNIRLLSVYHLILGTICYFYQGNSNNLATIDISVGFIGHHNPSMVFSGFLIFINTFGSQMLSSLLFFREMYADRSIRFHEKQKFKYITLICTLYMFVYTVLITFQRYHLFIWSVFAPKLLYLATVVLLYSTIMVCVILLELIYFSLLYFMSYLH